MKRRPLWYSQQHPTTERKFSFARDLFREVSCSDVIATSSEFSPFFLVGYVRVLRWWFVLQKKITQRKTKWVALRVHLLKELGYFALWKLFGHLLIDYSYCF